jgi:hypothetical protein
MKMPRTVRVMIQTVKEEGVAVNASPIIENIKKSQLAFAEK